MQEWTYREKYRSDNGSKSNNIFWKSSAHSPCFLRWSTCRICRALKKEKKRHRIRIFIFVMTKNIARDNLKREIRTRYRKYYLLQQCNFRDNQMNGNRTWCVPLPIHCWLLDNSHDVGKEVVDEERCLTVKSTFPTSPDHQVKNSVRKGSRWSTQVDNVIVTDKHKAFLSLGGRITLI